jgi:hypothetical protein
MSIFLLLSFYFFFGKKKINLGNNPEMSYDNRDLNKASPKDDFLVPHIDVLVDNMTRSLMYYFMDGFSRYN